MRIPEDERGEPYPAVVPLSSDAWEVFKEGADSLAEEAHTPGFPTRLEGVWSKLEAYLARLFLILALCRIAEQRGEERVEARDVVMASGMMEYFKAHARRVHMGLHGQDAHDLLAVELAGFLIDRGGEWNDEPHVLHEELKQRKSDALPGRADELSKMVPAISERGTGLKAERGWGKKGGESFRMLELRLGNSVDHEAD